MKTALAILLSLSLCLSAAAQQKLQHSKKYGKDHTADYQVGVLQSTEQVSTGTFTSCDHGCMSASTGHNVHYVVTEEGVYVIEAPTSFGKSFLQGALVSPNLPDVHVQWFMDELHPGDKILFAVDCNKHDACDFWLPKPDKQGKEYFTTGWFHPRVAPSNTNQLCGTGKLSAAVEEQVCKPAAPTPAAPVQTPQPQTPQPTTTATPMEQFKAMCDSGMFKPGRDDVAIQQCNITFPKPAAPTTEPTK